MEAHVSLTILMIASFATAFAAELTAGRIQSARRARRDLLFNLAAFFTQPLVSGVLVASIGGFGMRTLLPDRADALSGLPFVPVFLSVFFLNELCHYWVHRLSHRKPWLWKLHRTHHSGMDMNIGLVYRYNLFWPMVVPQAWIGAGVIYLGQGQAFFAAVAITYLVNVATHLSFRWDLYLRERFPWSEPAWWLIERVVTLPDTHHAHHAYGAQQAHPQGNFAVTIFLFDVLFGTARIPVARQEHFGLPISPRLPWAEELLWPLVRQPLLPRRAR